MTARHIHPDQGVVTSLHLTKKYIVVALDNAKIHVFNTRGDHQRTLLGHQMGVWAMVPWEDILVSGGCDRDVRVWNMATGYVEQGVVFRFNTDAITQDERPHFTRSHLYCPLPQDVGCENCNFWLKRHYAAGVGLDHWYMQKCSYGPSS